MEAPLAIPSYEKRFAAPRCSANVGWISRRRNPTFEWVGSVAVLGGGVQPVRGKRRKRLWRFRHTKGVRHTAIPIRRKKSASPPPNSRTPRMKARRLVCNGGYSRFAVNDGLRFANPSYELIRLTAFRLRGASGTSLVNKLGIYVCHTCPGSFRSAIHTNFLSIDTWVARRKGQRNFPCACCTGVQCDYTERGINDPKIFWALPDNRRGITRCRCRSGGPIRKRAVVHDERLNASFVSGHSGHC